MTKNAASLQPPPPRSEIPQESTWDLTPLYATPADWEKEFETLDALLAPVLALEGCLDSPENAAALFAAELILDRALERLYTFAHLVHDTDTAEAEGQAREARIRARYAELAAACAWITPELLSHPEEELRAWLAAPVLAPFRRRMEKTIRNKPHTLTTKEETLLAQASEVLDASTQTYSLLVDADLRFPPIQDAAGTEHPLNEGAYSLLLESTDRTLRANAYRGLFQIYGEHENTIASLLSTTVKSHNLIAELRGFTSARAAALFDDAIPEAVYDALITAVHAAFPDFQRYLEIRKRALQLDTLDMSDLYTPLIPEAAETIPPETAREWITAACAPLGHEYQTLLDTAFTSRWIDWPQNRGKRSGAYSSGCYDSPPYLLLNYRARLNDAFTLAHELGHSLHTRLANQTQPPQTAHYPIFLAEIASTLNEILLTRHLLATTPPSPLRTYLLQHFADSFKATLFRQTMFAEFERDIHHADAQGIPLTAEHLCQQYASLNRAYYAPAVTPTDPIAHEWTRIPHFQYNFYVYKYATSFCAALLFAERILTGESPDAYLELLRSGGAMDPLAALQRAGLDMTSPAVLADAFREFRHTLTALETALP